MTPVLLAFIAIAAQGEATLFERPDPQLEAGARALSNRNYDAAIDHYRKAKAKTTAERAIVEYNVGIAALRKAQDLQVEAAAKKVQVAKGAKDEATLDEATALTPDFEVAAEALERAFQLADDAEVRSQAALGRGNAFALQKKLKKAVNSYRQALVQNPKNLAARQNLRRTLVRMRAKKPPPQEGEGDESDDSGEGGSEEGEDGEKKSSNESGDDDGEEKDKQEKKEQQDSDEDEKEDSEKESDDDKEGQQEEGDDGADADGEEEKGDDDDEGEDKQDGAEGEEQDEGDKEGNGEKEDELDDDKKPGDDEESKDNDKEEPKDKSKEEKLKEEAEKKKEADKKKQEAGNPNEKKGSKAKEESKSPPKPGAQAKPKESPKKRRARALLDAMRRREKPLGSVMMPQQARPRRKVEKDW